jgi:thiaminase/transcriptional activator TenA
MLHDMLWRSNFPLALSCLSHPFVRALGDGTLPANLFRAYVAQDAFFLRAFGQVYALALARSGEMEAIAVFSELIGGVQEELKLHRVYAAELGIGLGSVVPNPACRAYTDFLLRTAWHDSLEEIVAAITPCMRLYAFLGRELLPNSDPHHPYKKWIDTYSSQEFSQLAERLEALLDRLCTDTARVREAYRYALRCELDFFSAVHASSPHDRGLEAVGP